MVPGVSTEGGRGPLGEMTIVPSAVWIPSCRKSDTLTNLPPKKPHRDCRGAVTRNQGFWRRRGGGSRRARLLQRGEPGTAHREILVVDGPDSAVDKLSNRLGSENFLANLVQMVQSYQHQLLPSVAPGCRWAV